MGLLKTHSNTSERQGNEAGKVREKKTRKEDVALRDRKKYERKIIAMSPVTGGGRGRCRALSHPTVGVARFGASVSDQFSSLSEQLLVRMKFLRVYSF